MSTTFVIINKWRSEPVDISEEGILNTEYLIEGVDYIEVAYRRNGLSWNTDVITLISYLPNNTKVYPIDNGPQGIYTLEDIINSIQSVTLAPIEPDESFDPSGEAGPLRISDLEKYSDSFFYTRPGDTIYFDIAGISFNKGTLLGYARDCQPGRTMIILLPNNKYTAIDTMIEAGKFGKEIK